MNQGRIALITGGVRSGKSQFAEDLTAGFKLPVVYLATASVLDDEMEMRVKIHRRRRPADWETIEEPLDADDVILSRGLPGNVIMLDCLTFWVTNLMFRQELPNDEEDFKALEEEILAKVGKAVKTAGENGANLVIVSNESGLGMIPPDRLSRKYQEIVGRANQTIAAEADEVYMVVAGLPVEIKGQAREIYRKLGEKKL